MPAGVALAASVVGWRTRQRRLRARRPGQRGLIALALAAQGGADGQAEGRSIPVGGWGIRDARGFQALAAVGMVDTATRTAVLTFLPFLLLEKGVTVAGVGGALAVLFAGGAAGKFVCGLVAERVGIVRTVVTELATALGIAAVALGSSSVTLVAPPARHRAQRDVVRPVRDGGGSRLPERRARAYGLYYTLIAASAAAPLVYGVLGDAIGVLATLLVTSTVVLLTLPLCSALRSALVQSAGARITA